MCSACRSKDVAGSPDSFHRERSELSSPEGSFSPRSGSIRERSEPFRPTSGRAFHRREAAFINSSSGVMIFNFAFLKSFTLDVTLPDSRDGLPSPNTFVRYRTVEPQFLSGTKATVRTISYATNMRPEVHTPPDSGTLYRITLSPATTHRPIARPTPFLQTSVLQCRPGLRRSPGVGRLLRDGFRAVPQPGPR